MIVNPFEFSQYTSNFLKTNIVLDSSGIGLTGIDALMESVVTQVKIRQEAIRIGYISNNPSLVPGRNYNLISLNGLTFDTPTSLYNASVKLVDAIKQMFAEHYSGIYESLAYKPSVIAGDRPTDNAYYILPGGFFHKITDPYGSETASNEYFEKITDLLDPQFFTQADLDIFNSPVRYTADFITFNDYLRAHVVWVNSVIALINKLKYCNKKLVFLYGETSLPGVDPGAGCTFSYSVSSNTVSSSPVVNKPIEIILDMSEVVTSCFDSISSYGFICIKWESTGAPSRFVIMPTAKPGDNTATDILRKPIWGAPEVNPSSILPAIYNPTDPPTGYYDSSQYDSRAIDDDIFRTWDPPPGNSNVYQRQTLPILRSECIVTNSTTPDLPFRNGGNGNEDADFACIKIDNSYFTTNTGSVWDYKIRLVIFPGCSTNDSGMYWSLNMTCLGCTNCNAEIDSCGGTPSPPSSSSSSGNVDGCNFNFIVNEPAVGVKERIIDLSGAPVGGPTGNRFMKLCLSYYTGTIKDRIVIVGTNGIDAAAITLLRDDLNTSYQNGDTYLSYRPFSTELEVSDVLPKHPLLGSSGSSWPPGDSIIYDSGCVAIPSNFPFKTIITINEDQVDFFDQTSVWYKKMRLFVFSQCSPDEDSASSFYGITLSCVTDECVPPSSSSSSSSALPSSSSSDIPPSSSSGIPPSSSSFSPPSSSGGGGTSSSSSFFNPCAGTPRCTDLPPGIYVTNTSDCSGAVVVPDAGNTAYKLVIECQECIDDPGRTISFSCEVNSANQVANLCACYDITYSEVQCCIDGTVVTYYRMESFKGKYPRPTGCDCTFICCCPDPVICNCIGYGSTITMADGSQKPVEDLQVGDALLSAVFNDINSLDNPGVNDLKLGWSISGSDKIILVKTFVKSINIGIESSIYKFKENLYLTFEHPVLIGQPDGTFNFRSAYYINSDLNLIDYNLNEVYLSAPTLIQSRHVTFTVQTEPYNSFFAGGILVHSGSAYSVQTPLGIGQIGLPVATNRYYENVYGTRNPNIEVYDPGIDNGEVINDGLVLQPLNEDLSISSSTISYPTIRPSASSTSSQGVISNRIAALGVYGSDIPAIWIKDAILDLGRIDIITFGDSNNNFNANMPAALGGWSDGIFDALSKLGAKAYASPLTFFDGFTETSNNPSVEVSSADYGYPSDNGNKTVILNGNLNGPSELKSYFENVYTRIRPNGKEINYAWLPGSGEKIWTSSLNFVSIISGIGAFNLDFQNKNIYYRVIYSPAVSSPANAELKGKLVLSVSDGEDRLVANTEAETIIPSSISFLSKEIALTAGDVSVGPVTFYTSSSKFGDQYGSVGPFAFLMHSAYTDTNGFSVSSLHSAIGGYESIERINTTVVQHNRYNPKLNRQENPLLELYLSEISKRQLSRIPDHFASSRVIIWINANPEDLNLDSSWSVETQKLISSFRSSWTNIGRTADSIGFIVSISPPSVPNDENYTLHRRYARNWVLSQTNTAFIDFSDIFSYTQLFDSNYFHSPSDTGHLNTNGYRSVSINSIQNALTKAEILLASSSSSGGIIIIESSSSSSSSRAPAVLGDINGDCQISSNEIALLLNCWNSTDPACLSLFDYDGNGEVGSSDLALILNAWGAVTTGQKSCVNPDTPIAWPIPNTCPDLNGDGILDCDDVNLLRQKFSQPPNPGNEIYDFNDDGAINELDARILLDFLQDPNNGPPGPKCIVCLIDQLSSSSSGGIIIIESSSSSGGIIIIESSSSSSEPVPSSSSAVVSSSSSELPPSSSSEVISSSSSEVISSSSSEVISSSSSLLISSSSSEPCIDWTSLGFNGCPLVTDAGMPRWGETGVLFVSRLSGVFLNGHGGLNANQIRAFDFNGNGYVSNNTWDNPFNENPTDFQIAFNNDTRCITCPPRPVCPDPVWNSFIGFNQLSGAYPNGLSVENCGADKNIRAVYNSIDGLSLHYKLTVFSERVTTDTNHPSTDNTSDAWIRISNGGSISFPADYWIAFALSNSADDRSPSQPDIISVQVQYENSPGVWVNYGNAFNITVNISPNWLNFVGFKEDGYIFPNGNYQRYVEGGTKLIVVNYTHTVPAGSNTTPKLAYRISSSLTGDFVNHSNAGIEYPNAEYPEWTVINSGDSILISNGEYLAFGLWHNGYFIDPDTLRTIDRSVFVSLSEQFTGDSYGNPFIISIDWCGRSFDPATLSGSSEVSAADLSIILNCWGRVVNCNCANADLNGDGDVGAADISILLNAWPSAEVSSSSSAPLSSSSSEILSSSSSDIVSSSSSSYQALWGSFTGYNGAFSEANGRWGNSEFITSTIGYRTLRITWDSPAGNDIYVKVIQVSNGINNSSYHVPPYPGFLISNGGTFGFEGPGVGYAYTAFALDPFISDISSDFTMPITLETVTSASQNGTQILLYENFATIEVRAFNAAPSSSSGPFVGFSSSSSGPGEESSISSGTSSSSSSSSAPPPSSSSSKIIVP